MRLLLLGSVSEALLRQSAESLAGRAVYCELPGLDVFELGGQSERLWIPDGFPESFNAAAEWASARWRHSLIRTYLERDIRQFRFPPSSCGASGRCSPTGRERCSMLRTSRSLDVSAPAAARYADLLADLTLVRRPPPYSVNVGKRLVKAPNL